MKKILLKAAPWLGAVLILSAILWPKLRPATRGPAAGADKPRESLPVQTMVIKTQPLEETLIATGTVRADESVDIRAEVSGKLMRIGFQEGAAVRAGELLAVINDAELRASLQRAIYRRELADLKTRRLAILRTQGGVTQQDYDISASELNVLGAEVAVIEAQLAHLEIRAPFDGVVGLRAVSEGAFVTPSTRIATFQRLDRLKVDFSIPEKYAYRINPDSDVSIDMAGSSRPLVGKIHAIEPLVDSATRTVLVRALCPNPSGRLFSGGFVSVRLALARIPEAILVPALALVPGPSDQSVFVVENGLARRRVVKTGTRSDSTVQITDGLRFGETVIVSGQQQVRAGQAVRALGEEARAPAAGGHQAKAATLN